MNTFPKISIVTPSFNQGKYLEKTILSVIEQDYPNLEYIIIDGGSTDNSVEIIKKYEKHLAYWVSEPDQGQSHAINKGFRLATGEIFGWLNSDDWYHPGALQAVACAFAANPDAGAVVGASEMVAETGQVMPVASFPVTRESFCHWIERYFMQPSCFFSQRAWALCGPLDETLHLVMDLDLWFNISDKFNFVTIENMLSHCFVHSDAKTVSRNAEAYVDVCLEIMKHGGTVEARGYLTGFLSELLQKRQETSSLQNELDHMIRLNEESVRHLSEERMAIEAKYLAMQTSLSWRVTKPIRNIIDVLRTLVLRD